MLLLEGLLEDGSALLRCREVPPIRGADDRNAFEALPCLSDMRKVYILQPVIDQWEEGVITSYEAVLKCVDLLAAYRNGHRFTPILNAWTGTLSFKMEKRDCSLAIGH